LGSVDRTRVHALLQALADGDGDALLAEVEALAEFSPDWGAVLEAVAATLHRIQVRQLVPGADGAGDDEAAAFAGRLRPEVVQLWYQMALHGRRDLSLAPGPRAGFEMSLLRMLAFRPAGDGDVAAPVSSTAPATRPAPRTATRASAASAAAALAAPAPPPTPPAPATPAAAPPAVAGQDGPRRVLASNDDWIALAGDGALTGPVRALAGHAAFVADDGEVLRLALAPADELLARPSLVAQLASVLGGLLGGVPKLRFE